MPFILSMASFFAAMVYLQMGSRVLRLGLSRHARYAFFFMTFNFALWAFAYAFLLSSKDVGEVRIWYRISALGWTLMLSSILYFCVAFTRNVRGGRRILILVLVYIPAVIFLIGSQKGLLLASSFKKTSFGWAEIIPMNSPWSISYLAFSIVTSVTGLYLIWQWGQRTKRAIEKKQARMIIVFAVISMLLSMSTNLLLPGIGTAHLPSLGHIIAGIWTMGIGIAITRYRFMELTPDIVVNEIVDKMNDLLVLTDPGGRITRVNGIFSSISRLPRRRIMGKPLSSLFARPDRIEKKILIMIANNRPSAFREKLSLGKESGIPARINLSLIRDSMDDIVGFFMIAHDLREMIHLKKEIKERRRAEKKLLSLNHMLNRYNENIKQELRLARSIQRNFIPDRPPHKTVAFYYKPMFQLGGDYLDFINLDKHKIGIFLSDVSGHGVPAAFITSMIRSIMLQSDSNAGDPGALLMRLNSLLYGNIDENFVTAFYCILDMKEHILLYANAGHNLPRIINGNAIVSLDDENRSKPLGVLSNGELESRGLSYSNREQQLEAGSRLFLYTDGLTEAIPGNSTAHPGSFEEEGLDPALRDASHLGPEDFLRLVIERLTEYRGSDSFDDDVCAVCVEI